MAITSRMKDTLSGVLGRQPKRKKLGAFIGVFTPSILTILGVIMYLRTGWMVGSVGLLPALGIVVIANMVTLISALSVSAVVTNMRVGKGGAYYIISRSLGIEFGAAVGIPLFLAMAFSVTLYAFGLAESITVVWAEAPERPIAALTVLLVALLAARGAGVALKLQLPIMVGILASLVALAIGALDDANTATTLTAGVEGGADFWTVFAVFFPAVTGIMAGISLSGDLEKPDRAIPLGTISAVLVGFVIYLTVPILLAAAATPEELVSNNLIWFDIAGPLSVLVLWGLWGAIFASAVGSILAAPRTLEAMVEDRIMPSPLGAPVRLVEGPGVPLLLTTALALVAVVLGDLDAIAPLLTMFFLTTYGTVNLVAGLEKLGGDPSYRPTFNVPWWVSIAGAFACFYVMFLINATALLIALVFEVGLYIFMRRRAMSAPWGDLRRGALMSLVRSTVIQLRSLPSDPRNWRPNILLYAGDVEKRPGLTQYASWLVQERGILTVAKLIEGDIEELADRKEREARELADELDRLGLVGFPEVDIVNDFEEGVISVAQANGIAGIESNTVMFGWSEKAERQEGVLRAVERLARLGKSVVIGRIEPFRHERERGPIHVWWGGLENNGDLLVLLAHLLSQNPPWRNSEIVINSITTNPMTFERNTVLLEELTTAARIEARTNVILKPEGASVKEVIWERSSDADVVLLGLRSNDPEEVAAYAHRMDAMMEGLPTVLFVRNAGAFRGQLLGNHIEDQQAAP
ncbi:MAG: amino acid permease [Acidimicrobiia bacterium]